MTANKRNRIETSRTEFWQRKLLPFMIGSIIFMGIFFFVVSLVNLYYLHGQVRHSEFNLKPFFEEYEKAVSADKAYQGLDYLRWKTLAFLEQDVVKRRYHQVNSAMLARVWTRYLGFVTGMILTLVGAVFILGKLREPPTKLEADTVGLKVALYTASPGILLAVLGTALMAITLAIPFEVATRDKATYVIQTSAPARPLAPVIWPEDRTRDIGEEEKELFGKEADKPVKELKGHSDPPSVP